MCHFLALRPEFLSNLRVLLSTPRYCQSATFGRHSFCVYTLLFLRNSRLMSPRPPRARHAHRANRYVTREAYMLNYNEHKTFYALQLISTRAVNEVCTLQSCNSDFRKPQADLLITAPRRVVLEPSQAVITLYCAKTITSQNVEQILHTVIRLFCKWKGL